MSSDESDGDYKQEAIDEDVSICFKTKLNEEITQHMSYFQCSYCIPIFQELSASGSDEEVENNRDPKGGAKKRKVCAKELQTHLTDLYRFK